jgi:hypothetical protein
MKNPLFLTIALSLLVSCGHSRKEPPANDDASVMVCTGRYSERYHDHKCRGLKSCKGEVITLTFAEAEKDGYTACGYYYK